VIVPRQFLVRSFIAAAAASALLNLVVSESLADPGTRVEAYRRHALDAQTPLESRVRNAPASVIAIMREAGRPDPKSHVLTRAERAQLKVAIESLPPVHRRILKERLRELSFLDGMPNTALTSTVNPGESFRLLDITVNAAILSQNVSEWLTQKEQTCFDMTGSPLRVRVDAGTKVDALVYVLIHESTHVIDAAKGITPAIKGKRLPCPFTEGVWNDLSLPVAAFRDPLRAHVRFYTNRDDTIPVDRAPAVYEWLRRTPFVSLYGGRNWLDDLAEFATVYHLTEVLKQPYRIIIQRNDKEVFVYEPMKSDLVRRRFGQMKQFYVGG
jgi:hypothetical protein